jgi:hypothetical protein
MATPSEKTHPRNGYRGPTDRRYRNTLLVETLYQLNELRFERHVLPTVATGQDEHGNIGRIDIGYRRRWQNREATHGLDRSRCQPDRLYAILAMPPQFRHGVSRLPIGKAIDYEQVDCFLRHSLIESLIGSWNWLTLGISGAHGPWIMKD